MESADRKVIGNVVRSVYFKAAIAEAIDQLKLEVQNALLTASPISEPMAMENLLRAQGRVSGAMRLIDILNEMGDEDGRGTDESAGE